ncbi:UDP-forming cellulose synthase catalytic subunit [Roseomonas sp. PWR1]|uniref:Cellulose synthase catalytic subunit [UDP-forming] n=1 Tax=Roseomonas nitratireducens TaxID=2820810 RepID=A0ABS4ALY0_9PROT|nr:UDP-forming cellulose synthase catalytic subunit [Neoroseomonas nitratireducens]MBP0462365.1 UDP-forming cellulose synthase catalytic subunit [Neoroseomonas nitratireducens]
MSRALSRAWLALVVLVGLVLAWAVVVTPLDAEDQALLAIGGLVLFLVLNRFKSRRVTAVLAILSCLVSLRYLHWRLSDTLTADSFTQGFFMFGLAAAETYAVIALLLGYFQTLRPLERRPAPMPEDHETWPTVDVYIPTYNEDLDVVRPTVLAALAMDWPIDKLKVWILDDGRRPAFREFAEECGAGYIVRPDNKGAKAGNLNHAMAQTDGEYIAIFDCDHVPTRAFLQMTMGWMLRDPKLGMIQTPHHFYSLDPFERNLSNGRDVPNEGLMFYGLVQPGNDLWNATFFCGSCAVLRREAIVDAGGVPTETVTEDCHASLRMQRLGWNTAYLRVPLAAGLATERLMIHIGQRMRWARGMLQIMRVDNPIFGPGLSIAQRLCYFSAMFHFLFALPRVVFLTAPLAFLLLGFSPIAASPLAIIAYAGPHIFHAVATGSRVAGSVRHSFWSEIYETVLALWLVPVTIATILDPKKGKFNVTQKGGLLPEGYFDWRAVYPSLILAILLALGVVAGVRGLASTEWGSLESQAYLLNGIWALLCIVPVLASVAAGRERKQVRATARVEVSLPAQLVLPDGRRIDARTRDLSLGGAGIVVAEAPALEAETPVMLDIPMGGEVLTLSGYFLRADGGEVQLLFRPQTVEEEGAIVRAVFGRADAWLSWDRHRPDRPLRSLLEVLATMGSVFTGRSQLSLAWWRARRRRKEEARNPVAPVATQRRTEVMAPRDTFRNAAVIALILVASSPALAQRRNAPPPPQPAATQPAPEAPPAVVPPPAPEAVLAAPPPPPPSAAPTLTQRRVVRSLRQLGLQSTMQLRGASPLQGIQFGIRSDEVVTDARVVISGAASPALVPEVSQLVVTLNDQFIGAVRPDPARPSFGPIEMPVNPAFFTEMNRLNFAFSGRYRAECVDPLSDLLWMNVAETSTVQLTLERLPLPADLARLPEPFFDPRELRDPLVLPFVMPDNPGNETLRGAAVVASWFAMQAEYRGARFPASVSIPGTGNAVVFATPQDTPEGMTLPPLSGPTVALMENPRDPRGMLLLVAGRTMQEAGVAAQALALAPQLLSGTLATVAQPQAPQRRPYDAPRWLPTDRPVQLGELVDRADLQVSGYAPGPITVPLRTAPDLTTWRRHGFPVDLAFRSPPGPITDVERSRLDVLVSGTFLRSIPLREQESWPWTWMLRQVGIEPGPRTGTASVPPWLVTGRNDLQLVFDMRPLHRGDCVSIPAQVQAAVDPSSTIDITRAHRFATLPNLAFFASAGFPYTRLADLSETAVVMPDRAGPIEVSAFLGMVGGLSAMVGVPATGLAVVRPGQLQQVADRDLIVLGTLGRQPALTTLLREAPLRIDEAGRLAMTLPDPLAGFQRVVRGGPPPEERVRAAAQLAAPAERLGFVAAAQSPLREGRSVLAIAAPTPAGIEAVAEALRDPATIPRVQGDLMVLSADGAESFRTAPTYSVGNLPFWLWPNHYLGSQPWSVLFLLVGASVLIGLPVMASLRRRAVRRLRGRG